MRFVTELERHRVRRTLAEVRRKLEEALRLSRLRHERNHEEATAANRHR